MPNEMDIYQARLRTSGIVEVKYIVDGVVFTMIDVGGQRNERKKWMHCFDNVTAVIFVVAINEYDQVLYEDNKTKRMVEAIKVGLVLVHFFHPNMPSFPIPTHHLLQGLYTNYCSN